MSRLEQSWSAEPVILTEKEKRCLELNSPEELKKSKYDLPIEFHPKIHEMWLHNALETKSRFNLQGFMKLKQRNFEKYLLSQKTSVMYLCDDRKSTRSSRFKNLKEKVLLSTLRKRTHFCALRIMAIQLLRHNVLAKMQIIAENEVCPSLHKIPHKLFSWSPEDFYKRRRIEHTHWLDNFESSFKEYLEIMKFKYDMKELIRYLDMTLCGALIEDQDYSFENDVITPLEDASDLLSIYTSLQVELAENRRLVVDLRIQYQLLANQVVAREEEVRSNIMAQLTDVDLIHPVRYRYHKAWYEAQVDQVELKHENTVRKLNSAIEEFQQKKSYESMSQQNSISMYYAEIEYYRMKINEFNAKCDNEYEQLENAISYKKMSMSKLELQRKFCEEQIDPMREKVNEYRARKLLEKEQKMRLERERAAAELLKILHAEEKKKRKEMKAMQKGAKKK